MAYPQDYDAIAQVVDDWWGRPVLSGLPRLFLDHFHATSLVAKESGDLVGFLIGLMSPSTPDEAYIHFAGVAPGMRGRGLARAMYERFFQTAREHGRHTVAAITSPHNAASIAFHRRLGFYVRGPVRGYNGPGNDMVLFQRPLLTFVPSAGPRS